MATCPYRAVPGRSVWSTLEAIGLNTEFIGGVLVARMLDGMKFALGPTIAARRETLEKIGGFDAVKDFLAEDFVMGKLAAERGVRGDSVVVRDRASDRGAGLRGERAASAAVEPEHAAVAAVGICRAGVHESAAAGAAAVGRGAGVVGGGGGRACAEGGGGSGDGGVGAAGSAGERRLWWAVPAQDVASFLGVGRRIFREYDRVAGQEVLSAAGRPVRAGRGLGPGRAPPQFARGRAPPRLPRGAVAPLRPHPAYSATRRHGRAIPVRGSRRLRVSGPVIAVEAAVLDGFGDVLGGDRRRAADIRDGARDFENAIVGARRKAHTADGHLERALAGSIEGALFTDQARGHARVVIAAGLLDRAGAFDTFADLGGGFGRARRRATPGTGRPGPRRGCRCGREEVR